MAKRPYLQQPKDRSGWVFRVVIPKRLRLFHGGVSEFKRVLGPTYSEAIERYPAIAHDWATLHARLKELADSGETHLESTYIPPATYKVFTARETKLLEHFIQTWECATCISRSMNCFQHWPTQPGGLGPAPEVVTPPPGLPKPAPSAIFVIRE